MTNTESIKDTEGAVKSIMATFVAEYGANRFQINKQRKGMWIAALSRYHHKIILAAAEQILLTSKSEWPPTIGQMVDMARRLSNGELHEKSADEAWMRVQEYSRNADIPQDYIDDIEFECMRRVGGSHHIKTTNLIESTRAAFVRNYNELSEKKRIEQITSLDVMQLVEKRQKLLKE